MKIDDFYTTLDKNLIKLAEDAKVIEEKRLPEPKENIVEKAHPEPEYIADAKGDGGLVENKIEQHQKGQEIVNKMPTGNYINLYSSVLNSLVKIANELDDNGDFEAADVITDFITQTLPLV